MPGNLEPVSAPPPMRPLAALAVALVPTLLAARSASPRTQPGEPRWLLAREAILIGPAPAQPEAATLSAIPWQTAAATAPHIRALALEALPLCPPDRIHLLADPPDLTLQDALAPPYRLRFARSPTTTAKTKARLTLLRALSPGGRAPRVLRKTDAHWRTSARRLRLEHALALHLVEAAIVTDSSPQPWLILRTRCREPLAVIIPAATTVWRSATTTELRPLDPDHPPSRHALTIAAALRSLEALPTPFWRRFYLGAPPREQARMRLHFTYTLGGAYPLDAVTGPLLRELGPNVHPSERLSAAAHRLARWRLAERDLRTRFDRLRKRAAKLEHAPPDATPLWNEAPRAQPQSEAQATQAAEVLEREPAWRAWYEQRFSEARRLFERHLERRPNDALAHAALGTTLHLLGERREARRHLRIAAANLHDPDALFALAEHALGFGEAEIAFDALSRCRERAPHPTRPEVERAFARAALELGRVTEARKALERAGVANNTASHELRTLQQQTRLLEAAQRGDTAALAHARQSLSDPTLDELATALSRRLTFDAPNRLHLETRPMFESSVVNVPDGPLAPEDLTRTPSAGWHNALRLEHRLLESERNALTFAADAEFDHWFSRRLPDRTRLGLELAFAPRIAVVPTTTLRRWRTLLNYRFDHLLLAGRSLVQTHTAIAGLSHTWHPDHETSLALGFETRRYFPSPDDPRRDRDGHAVSFTLGHWVRLPLPAPLELEPNLALERDLREGSDYDLFAWRLGLALGGRLPFDAPLWWRLETGLGFERYLSGNSLASRPHTPRRDRTAELALALTWPLETAITLDARYRFTTRKSNLRAFDVKSHHVALELALDF